MQILRVLPTFWQEKAYYNHKYSAALEHCFTLCYKCAFRGAQYQEKSGTQEHVWSRSSLNILLGTKELGGAATEMK